MLRVNIVMEFRYKHYTASPALADSRSLVVAPYPVQEARADDDDLEVGVVDHLLAVPKNEFCNDSQGSQQGFALPCLSQERISQFT